ncbi:terminase large subunit, partial [Streptococcus mutans]|nr:terminase large subunit [Streptococcus mutans]
YTNNVKVMTDAKGNRTYGKKDEHRRKTDGFHAFIHALYRDDLIDDEMDFMLGDISF